MTAFDHGVPSSGFRRPSQALAYVVTVGGIVFTLLYLDYVTTSMAGAAPSGPILVLLVAKTAVELVAGWYGLAFLAGAVAFVCLREPGGAGPGLAQPETRIGIVYLCCNDLDQEALRSLTRLTYRGPLSLVIHDDSRSPAQHAAVDRLAGELSGARDWQVLVLRRPDTSGGKAGAVNYVLEQAGDLFDYFLLCDNDSTVLTADCVERSLPRFACPEVAVVQYRTVHVDDPQYCATNRLLAPSISAFHAFLLPASRFGWMPFVGHNACLRTSAVRQAGGLTPGFFSDDLDLTVRLNLMGFRVAYAPDIAMGEKHPPSYAAFRKRSYKWAYGCVQTLRAHTRQVLTSRRFTFAERLSFFQFAGFYVLQCLLLVYLAFTLLVLPFGMLGDLTLPLVPSLLIGTLLALLVYVPLASYYLKQPRRERGWGTSLLLCGLVYGGTDMAVCRGVMDSVLQRQRPWAPTNAVGSHTVDRTLFVEAVFGLLLLSVPLAYRPEMLFLPCWYLFGGKFLFGPWLSLSYRDGHDAYHSLDPDRVPRARRFVTAGSRVDAVNS